MKRLLFATITVSGLMLMASCGGEAPPKTKSSATGWQYNNKQWGGFESTNYKGQQTGPGLVFIEGGTFTMGSSEMDVGYEHNNFERRVTVQSFYMDETEVRNQDYREYLWWITRVFSVEDEYSEYYKRNLPDTLVWRDKLAFNEPMVKYYFRHPAYDDYPLVGVSWVQANSYAAWRTDRVNENILVKEGYIKLQPEKQSDADNFNTEAYLAGQVGDNVVKFTRQKNDLRPGKSSGKKTKRLLKMEDGVFLPEYRLPTEAEWEYAAYGYKSQSFNENIDNKKIYPWQGLTTRNTYTEKDKGKFMDNFKRGRGDFAGVAGRLNDRSFITTQVKPITKSDKAYSFANDFGLYHMGANVSEWVMDVYRPMSLEDFTDFNSYRGNVFQQQKVDASGANVDKDSLGKMITEPVTPENAANRLNYDKADNIGYKDEINYQGGEQQYDYSVNSLLRNSVRVVKGGSWNDLAYYMAPGTRRYLEEERAMCWLGFRCAMIRVGDPIQKKK